MIIQKSQFGFNGLMNIPTISPLSVDPVIDPIKCSFSMNDSILPELNKGMDVKSSPDFCVNIEAVISCVQNNCRHFRFHFGHCLDQWIKTGFVVGSSVRIYHIKRIIAIMEDVGFVHFYLIMRIIQRIWIIS